MEEEERGGGFGSKPAFSARTLLAGGGWKGNSLYGSPILSNDLSDH